MFKFQAQDSDLEYFFFQICRFEKRISLSENKPPLTRGTGSFDVNGPLPITVNNSISTRIIKMFLVLGMYNFDLLINTEFREF